MHPIRRFFVCAAAIAALLVVAAPATLVPTAAADQPFSESELDARIRAFLLNNPDVVVEAVQTWQTQQRQAQAQQAVAALAARRDELVNDPDAPVAGNPDGDVTVVEFMDDNCGYCRKVYPLVTALIEQDPNVRVLFKEFPILGPGSEFAARAALATRRQNRYEAFHDAMMRANQRRERAQVLDIARRIGLDIERLLADMQDAAHQQLIDRNHRLAQTLSLSGTPSFVIGNEIVRGATTLEHLQQLVDKARSSE